MSLKKIVFGITVLAVFLVPIFPLIVANSLFFPFITGKAIFFRFVVEIAFAGWVILAFMDPKYRPRFTWTSFAVLVFTAVILVADLLGVNPIRSIWSNFERMEGWLTIAHLAGLFFVISNLFGHYETNKKLWQKWFVTNLGVGTAVALYGLLQLANVVSIHQGSTRVDASLGNSAYMAVYMLFMVGISVFILLSQKDRFSLRVMSKDVNLTLYWTYFVVSIIVYAFLSDSSSINAFFDALKTFASTNTISFIVGTLVTIIALAYPYRVLPILFTFLIFQTQTRGTILGLIGGLLLSLAIYALLAEKKAIRSKIASASVIVLIIVIGIVFWTNRDSSIVKNNEVLNRLATISLSDVKTQARGYIWPMAVKGALERPLFGWGQENFNYIFNANYEPAMYAQEQWFDRAHSVFLDWLVAGGIIGLLAYLALYVLLLTNIWKSSLTVAEKSVLTGLVAGYFIHNIFVFDNIASYVMFFAILGFADSQFAGKHRVLFGNRVFQKDTIEYVVLPVVIVLFVLTLYSVQYRVIKANTRLITALISCSQNGMPDPALYQKALAVDSTTANQEIREQILNCALRVINAPQAPGPMKQSFFALAMQEIQNQISYAPKDARIYVLGGSFMNGIGQYGEAVPLLEKALELSPRKQSIIYDLATSYINLNKNIDKAVELMKGAYESAKDNSQAKISYATTLISADKEKEAKELYKDNPTALITPQVAQVYFIKKQYTKAIEIYKALVKENPKDVNYRAQLAQTQFVAGFKYDAIETLRTISRDNPELKDQVEQAIKQIEKK